MLDDVLKELQNVDPLLPAKKVAAMLGLRPHTLNVWRWLERLGKPAPNLPYVKVGRRSIRYRLSDVKRFIEKNRRADPEQAPTAPSSTPLQ